MVTFLMNGTLLLLFLFLKKGDLSDCNNYRSISLINVGLKILSKIVTKRISDYSFSNGIIRPEQFGFRNKEECISLFVSIREICQRRKFKDKFTFLAFLDLKKAYDSVPIYNILNMIMPTVAERKRLLFDRYKLEHTKSVKADNNPVRQASRANATSRNFYLEVRLCVTLLSIVTAYYLLRFFIGF